MDEKASKGTRPTPPKPSGVRITSEYLQRRGKVGMTLTKDELQRVAELLRAGQVMTKDYRGLPKNMKQAMSKLGVDTRGL